MEKVEDRRYQFVRRRSSSSTGLAFLHRFLRIFGLLNRDADQRLWELRLCVRFGLLLLVGFFWLRNSSYGSVSNT